MIGTLRPRKSILGEVGLTAQKTPLPDYNLRLPNMSKPSFSEIEVGSFYEIAHSKLPFRTPSLLRAVRIVMVTAKTEMNVTIRYPSAQSLEAYFDEIASLSLRSKMYPALDEKFIMGPMLAVEALGRQIPSREFGERRHSKLFWLARCFDAKRLSAPISDSKNRNGPLFEKLKRCDMGWGSHRVVAYLREPETPQETKSTLLHEEDKRRLKKEESHETRVKEEESHETRVKEEESHETKDSKIIRRTMKRKRGRPPAVQSKKRKQCPKPKPRLKLEPIEQKPKIREKNDKQYVDRWPVNRYEAAARELGKVLEVNGAVHGKPISRFNLREQARRSIGDTGLLDHMLKHLAGKVVPGGSERLRRRCDAEGKMEYWLESADLAGIRKEAGVKDPYWVPPPGWKLGDCVTGLDCNCGQEMRLLKEELSSMRSQIEELKSKDDDERSITVVLPDGVASAGRPSGGNLNLTSSRNMYEALLRKKSTMEEQLVEISTALLELEEGMEMISHREVAARGNSLLLADPIRNLQGAAEMHELNEAGIEDFAEAAGGELSDSDGEEEERQAGRMTRQPIKLKLKPCSRQENNNSYLPSQPVDDVMAMTPFTASPLSSTTS